MFNPGLGCSDGFVEIKSALHLDLRDKTDSRVVFFFFSECSLMDRQTEGVASCSFIFPAIYKKALEV